MNPVEMIIALRGGFPEKCDFCGQHFTEANYPTPEEGGEWACIECVTRWYKEEIAERQRIPRPHHKGGS